MSDYWESWLEFGEQAGKNVENMARLFANPAEFWRRVQKTIERAGENDDSAEKAISEIKGWLAKDRWSYFIRNCPERFLPGHGVERREDFSQIATRFTRLLNKIPAAITHYRKAKSGGEDVGIRNAMQSITNKDFFWRFFGDPQIHVRRVVDFPFAIVSNQDTNTARGHVIRATIEILEPGEDNYVLHPLLELSSLKVEPEDPAGAPTFAGAIKDALAAGKAASNFNGGVTVGFFSPQFLDHGIEDLSGTSAGGAFALAFERALAGKVSDQRVIVITTTDDEGNLGPVDNHRTGPEQNGATFLQLKASGILDHNRDLPWDARTHIDTIAVVEAQQEDMEKALEEALKELSRQAHNPTSVLNDIRVVAIEKIPTVTQK